MYILPFGCLTSSAKYSYHQNNSCYHQNKPNKSEGAWFICIILIYDVCLYLHVFIYVHTSTYKYISNYKYTYKYTNK